MSGPHARHISRIVFCRSVFRSSVTLRGCGITFRFGVGGMCVTTMADVTFVVGHKQSGDRERNYHTDNSKQATPYREREKNDSGIEAHFLAHHMGSHNVVADALARYIDQTTLAELRKERNVASERVDKADRRHRDKSDILKIGDHIENADKYAHRDGKRHTDNRKANTIENHREQCNDTLTAKVTIHVGLHIVDHHHCTRTIFVGDYEFESSRNLGVVDHYEEEIDESEKPCNGVDYDVDRFLKNRRPFAENGLDMVDIEHRTDIVGIEVTADKLDSGYIIIGHLFFAGRNALEDVAEQLKIFYDGRQKQVDDQAYQNKDLDKCQNG